MSSRIRTDLIVLTIVACVAWTAAAACAAEGAIPQEEMDRIRTAAPGKPRVQPREPRRLLVLSRAWGYKHSAIPYGASAVEAMAEKTGAFEAVVTRDVDLFEPGKLREFDAVFLNNCNNEIFLPSPQELEDMPEDEKKEARKRAARLRQSLRDFVRNGGGLVGLHAAVAAFREWPEYGDIIGARYVNHPWNAGSTVTLKVAEPHHPLAQAFAAPHFELTDEIYQVTDPYSRRKVRVLLSIDTTRTNMNVDGIRRQDGDFAMSWVKNYGSGRVFYFAPGHQSHIFWNSALLQHMLDGIQFALGDLPADTTPSAVERPPYSGDWEGMLEQNGDTIPAAAQVIGRGGDSYLVKVYEGTDTTGAPSAELETRISGGSIKMEGRTNDGGQVRATGTISSVRMEGEFSGDTEGSFWLHKVVKASPTMGSQPPEGAVVLFDGADTGRWEHPGGKQCGWSLLEGEAMEVKPGAGSIVSKQKFGDQRIHLEFSTPYMPEARGQARGNSGVYVQGLYEVQILDSYGLEPRNNRCGGIYTVSAPRVNACAPPRRWQTYDIQFRAPRFDDEGQKVEDARMTVWHNGIKVHDNVKVPNPTRAHMDRDIHGPGPLYLQDHGTPVRYRNIWVEELNSD